MKEIVERGEKKKFLKISKLSIQKLLAKGIKHSITKMLISLVFYPL